VVAIFLGPAVPDHDPLVADLLQILNGTIDNSFFEPSPSGCSPFTNLSTMSGAMNASQVIWITSWVVR
jgi:hypothetical protein